MNRKSGSQPVEPGRGRSRRLRDRPEAAPPGPLDRYRSKRSVEASPEPSGVAGAERPGLFVVQKHAARRTHYDFRLERGGVLWSWAVPHGPSLDPSEKRLAVHVEDHPVEYADFEGIIPEGNYGAGAVIVWDRGIWIPYDDPDEGIRTGKLHFELQGFKLRGVWTLVRLKKGSGKDWLLFKKKDGWAALEGTKPLPEESILSGLTVEELREGTSRAVEIRTELAKLRAPRRPVDPGSFGPMLAETAGKPFSGRDWVFELKLDGYRLLAVRNDDQVRLLSRNGHDLTAVYPEIARAVRALPHPALVMDGELVVLGEEGRPDFQRLQRRSQIRRRLEIKRASMEQPTTLFLFDLLGYDDFDLRGLPLVRRKEVLRRILPRAGPLRYSDHVEEHGEELFEQVSRMGLEGLIAKKADAPYRSGRSSHWLKLVADRLGDFVVCGYSRPQGARAGFGALHLGVFEDGKLVYAGRAGSGFSADQLDEFHRRLEGLVREEPPCMGNLPRSRDHVWVEPALVAEVRYKTWTEDGLLRHPVFVRLRDDKPVEECTRPGKRPATGKEPRDSLSPDRSGTAASRGPTSGASRRVRTGVPHGAHPAPATAEEPDRTVRFSRLDKVFWPRERYTKRDLIEYYRAISPWLLPYLRGRPLVLTRYPDGIEGKSFYQKNAPGYMPPWIRRESIWSGHSEREIEYVVCDDEETLLYLANLGTIPLHIWSSRLESLASPDWCILDLDPKGAPFTNVVQLARAVHELCEDMGLSSFAKTSGSTGLHVLVPLGRQCTYEQSRMLGHLIARVLLDEHPEIATVARALSARAGKVYLDYLQNRHGQLLVAPFSARPLPGAPVSTPLDWSEVGARLAPERFTIRTVPERMRTRKQDPVRAVMEVRPDLASALQRLARRLETGAARKRKGRKP